MKKIKIACNIGPGSNNLGLLVNPHGGKLVDRLNPSCKNIPNKKIDIDDETLMELEQIAIGAFSPLEGFMKKDDFYSVVDKMRLSNGTIWPLPIFLAVNEETKRNLNEGEDISLFFDKEVYGILHLSEIYNVNKEEVAEKIFGTKSLAHPGVEKFMSHGEWFLGGKITLLKKRMSEYKIHELTPKQTRKIFADMGWSKVVGFHTRNVVHRAHEFIQIEAIKRGFCDGLFVHPIVGKKKKGDFRPDIIISTYDKMVEKFYPKSRVVFGVFATYPRYCGPREAIFTALVRKNFGCSHFVVGRDHAGVGNFYDPMASHKIFDKFKKDDLGIEPIIFNRVFYSDKEKKYIHESEFENYPKKDKFHISGTKLREILKDGKQPPDWFMRPEISRMLLEKIKKGEKIFVE